MEELLAELQVLRDRANQVEGSEGPSALELAKLREQMKEAQEKYDKQAQNDREIIDLLQTKLDKIQAEAAENDNIHKRMVEEVSLRHQEAILEADKLKSQVEALTAVSSAAQEEDVDLESERRAYEALRKEFETHQSRWHQEKNQLVASLKALKPASDVSQTDKDRFVGAEESCGVGGGSDVAAESKAKKEVSEASNQELAEQVESLRCRLTGLEADLESKASELDKIQAMQRTRESEYTKQIQNLERDLEQLRRAEAENSELSALSTHLEELKFQKAEKETNLQTTIDNLESENNDLMESISKYKAVSATLNTKIKALEAEKEACDKSKSELASRLLESQEKLIISEKASSSQKVSYETIIKCVALIEEAIGESSKALNDSTAAENVESVGSACDGGQSRSKSNSNNDSVNLDKVAKKLKTVCDKILAACGRLQELQKADAQKSARIEVLIKEATEMRSKISKLSSASVDFSKQNAILEEKLSKMKPLLLRANRHIEDNKRKIAAYKQRVSVLTANQAAMVKNSEERWICVPDLRNQIASKDGENADHSDVPAEDCFSGVDPDICKVVSRVKVEGLVWVLLRAAESGSDREHSVEHAEQLSHTKHSDLPVKDGYNCRTSTVPLFWTTQEIFLTRKNQKQKRKVAIGRDTIKFDLTNESKKCESLDEVLLSDGTRVPEESIQEARNQVEQSYVKEWNSNSSHFKATLQDLTERLESQEAEHNATVEEYARYKARAHAVLQAKSSELDAANCELAMTAQLRTEYDLLAAENQQLQERLSNCNPDDILSLTARVESLRAEKERMDVYYTENEKEYEDRIQRLNEKLLDIKTASRKDLDSARRARQEAKDALENEHTERIRLQSLVLEKEKEIAKLKSSLEKVVLSGPQFASSASSQASTARPSPAILSAYSQPSSPRDSSMPSDTDSRASPLQPPLLTAFDAASFRHSHQHHPSSIFLESTLSTFSPMADSAETKTPSQTSSRAASVTGSENAGGDPLLHLAALQAERDHELQRLRKHVRDLQQLLRC